MAGSMNSKKRREVVCLSQAPGKYWRFQHANMTYVPLN